jgi:hypothetical protein
MFGINSLVCRQMIHGVPVGFTRDTINTEVKGRELLLGLMHVVKSASDVLELSLAILDGERLPEMLFGAVHFP